MAFDDWTTDETGKLVRLSVVPIDDDATDPDDDAEFTDHPAPMPSDLGVILDNAETFMRRFLVLPDEAFAVLPVWVAHVFAFEAAEFTPYLSITSALARSGKSRVMEVIEVILGESHSISTASISAASLYRLIDGNPGMAVLIDEVDRFSKEKAEELWGLINSGWRLGGKAHRQGGARMNELQTFSTFSPKVLAGIGQPLPDTVADRSIKIRMQRRTKDEPIERLRLREANIEAAPIREALRTWAAPDVVDALQHARPSFPAGMDSDRAMDAAEPLLAIAEMAGDRWASRLREALVKLEGAAIAVSEEETQVQALRVVLETFEAAGNPEVISNSEMVRAFVRRDDGMWAEWWGKAVDADKLQGPKNRLARLLKPFDIHPKERRVEGGGKVRGYLLMDVSKAASRYLLQQRETPETTATPLASAVADVSGVSDDVQVGETEALQRVKDVLGATDLEGA